MKKLMIQQTITGLLFPIFIFLYPANENLPEAYFFPRLLAFIILFLLLLHWLFYLLKAKKTSDISPAANTDEKPLKEIIFYFVALVLTIVLLQYLGFYLTSFLFYLAISYYYRIVEIEPKKITMLISALAFVLAIYFVFALLLKVQTPSSF